MNVKLTASMFTALVACATLAACGAIGGVLPDHHVRSTPTPAPGLTPTPVPTSPPTGTADPPTLVGVYCKGYAGSTRNPSQLAQYVTWCANPSPTNLAAVQAAGMRTYLYTDFMNVYSNGSSPMYPDVVSNPQVIAKDCSGNKITVSAYGGGYQDDPTVPLLFTLWIKDSLNATGFTAYFIDDVPGPAYTASASPCNLSAWPAAIAASVNGTIFNGAPLPMVIYNGLPGGPTPDPRMLSILDATTVPAGAMLELCYGFASAWGKSEGVVPLAGWIVEENDEIAMAQRRKLFWCYSTESTPGSSSQSDRIFVYASFLLTYAPATSVIEEAYDTQNGIDGLNFVAPEFGLTFAASSAAPTDISQLAQSGVYVRLGLCYYRNSLVGACAIAVNPDASSHSYNFGTAYKHTLTVSGGSVFDGGTVSLTGPAPPGTLGPQSAVVALP